MREIKFRAWDKKKNMMVYENTYICDMTITFGGQVFCHDSYYEIHDYDFDLMQYTGLKDKNGKEIYEGDILRFEDSTLIQVVFVDCSARFAGVPLDTKKYGSAEWTIDGKRYEIVSNIYENPELIKCVK
jgi:uncharacterized phage protein (TIGR01671 family)